MNKQSLFTLLFSSWIFGISLICLFPPIPDYSYSENALGYLSQDEIPEINQRNSIQSYFFHLDSGFEFLESEFDFNFKQRLHQSLFLNKENDRLHASSYFNTILLFKAFFETW